MASLARLNNFRGDASVPENSNINKIIHKTAEINNKITIVI